MKWRHLSSPPVDGCNEGWAVGSADGSAVGCSEGTADGSLVGSADGSELGSAEGSLEGYIVGSAMGSLVGKFSSSPIKSPKKSDGSMTDRWSCCRVDDTNAAFMNASSRINRTIIVSFDENSLYAYRALESERSIELMMDSSCSMGHE